MTSSQILYKDLAKEYACSMINITNVVKFIRHTSDEHMHYLTFKGAFIFPIKGKCNIHFGDKTYQAVPGKLIHGCPGQKLEFEVEGSTPFEHINLYYESNNTIQLEMDIPNYEQIRIILEELLNLPVKRSVRTNYRREQLYEHLFDLLFNGYITDNIKTNQHLIQELVDYIQDNFNKPLTLSHLAEFVGKKPQQLSYLFHLYMGIRPIDYVIQCRLEHAIELLKEEAYSVQDVARMIGYPDPLYFSRLFKKHTGHSPSQIRNN